MLKKKIKWWGMDTGSCDHAMNTSIRTMRPDLAEKFTKQHGKTPGEFFGTFHYTHKKSGRQVSADVFPFHNWAFQEGLLHAENLGGDIEMMLGKRMKMAPLPGGAGRGDQPGGEESRGAAGVARRERAASAGRPTG